MQNQGANWKDLVLLCGNKQGSDDGELSIIKNHLQNGLDPNFQHPEYMTTPLIEASRVGNVGAVDLLLGLGKADPAIESDLDGCTPLDVAMQAKQHATVDILLRAVPENYETECKLILISGTQQRDIITHFLTLGHRVILACAEISEADEEQTASTKEMVEELKKKTGNSKLWVYPIHSDLHEFLQNNVKTLANVDTWIHKVSDHDNVIRDIVSYHRHCGLEQQEKLAKILILLESKLFDGSTRNEMASLLSTCTSNTKIKIWAVLEPSSWWDKMTYGLWYKIWVATLSNLLGLDGSLDGGAHGKLYTYSQQCVMCEPDGKADDDVDKQLILQLRSLF